MSLQGVCPGFFVWNVLSRVVFVLSNKKFNITLNFRFHMFENIIRAHNALDPPSVTNSHLGPFERDVLGQPISPFIGPSMPVPLPYASPTILYSPSEILLTYSYLLIPPSLHFRLSFTPLLCHLPSPKFLSQSSAIPYVGLYQRHSVVPKV